jgi:small GTP-binding protein
MIKLKVIVAGAKDVGKTSLIHRFVSGKFNVSSISTIGVDFLTKNLQLDGKDVHLSLWDFAGEVKFRVLFPSYCSGASGALLLYDITSRSSFEDLKDWISLINNSSGKIVKLLIGSKADLRDQRKISLDEAQKFQKDNKIEQYLECSAKTGENVNLIFETLTRAILSSSLKNCPYCKELIPKELIFCQYCGRKLI